MGEGAYSITTGNTIDDIVLGRVENAVSHFVYCGQTDRSSPTKLTVGSF
jgi:hypothetical protein